MATKKQPGTTPLGDSGLKRLAAKKGFSVRTVKNVGVYFIKGNKTYGPFDGRYNSESFVLKKIS